MTTHPKTARFWTWHLEGYVRIKLQEYVSLNWATRGPTDEGWAMRAETWVLDQGVVRNIVVTDGTDCDGRMSTFAVYECPVADLAGHCLECREQNPDRICVPKWTRVEGRQRDYAAEAAGY